MEKKFTEGEWMPVYVSGVCIGVSTELAPMYQQMIVNTILPDTDKQYAKEKKEIEANASLIASAPTLYGACELALTVVTDSTVIDALRKALERARG